MLEDAHGIMEEGLYRTWYAASDMLGMLKATEAIDVLIRYLDFSDRITGLSISHRPAVKALVQIGDAAVPRLTHALFNKDSPTRGQAAEALGHIGGGSARRGLRRALRTETNAYVIDGIKRALKLMAR